MAGVLYVVSTPIGNPEDLTVRALRILRDVQCIAAENPQETARLLRHYDVNTPVTTYHDRNKEEKTPVLVKRLEEGHSIALVSDAGTPVVFDPGSYLIKEVFRAGLAVLPVPGPCAALAALSVSGLSHGAFVVQGPLPEGAHARRTFLEGIQSETRTVIVFIGHRRVRSSLRALHTILGARPLALVTNMTLPDEHIFRGTAEECVRHLTRRPLRGEWTLVIGGLQERAGEKKKPVRPHASES